MSKQEEGALNTLEKDVNDSDDVEKEKRLEAARKKVEELKKKKKKDKKKASKSSTTAQSSDVVTEAEATSMVTAESEKNKEEISTEKKDDIENPSSENTQSQNEEIKLTPITSLEPDTTPSKEDSQNSHSSPVTDTKASESGTANNEESGNKEIHRETILALEDAVKNLKSEIDEKNQIIVNLRNENAEVKMKMMDLEDKIDDLESKLKEANVTSVAQPVFQSYTEAEQAFTINEYASDSKSNLQEAYKNSNFRDRLLLWKGWQVDISSWSGLYKNQAATF